MIGGQYEYAPVNRIFAKLSRDITDLFDEDTVIEWIGEALEAMQAVPAYEEAVAFIVVKNHQASVPNGLHQIQQIGRNVCWNGVDDTAVCPADVLTDIKDADRLDPLPSLPVPLDCNGSPLTGYDVAYYRPYYDLSAEYYGWTWSNSTIYHSCFKPVTKATSSLIFEEKYRPSNPTPYYGNDQYQCIRNKVLRFNFQDGQIALQFLRQAIDEETGYPLIPDTKEHTTAVVAYITYMMMKKEFYRGREGSGGRYDRAEADWHWYCGQAKARDLMPRGEDDHQNLFNQRQRLLPTKPYYGFFGNLGKPENRRWDDPDRRNYNLSYFRGSAIQ